MNGSSELQNVEIRVDEARGVGFMAIDRPDRANAIDDRTINELSEAYRTLDRDRRVRAIIFSGTGKGFCSGHDLMIDPSERPKDTMEDIDILVRQNNRLLDIYMGDTPVIAKIHGYCLGAAVEMVLLCDLSVATLDARFAHPAIRGAGGSPNALTYPFALGFSKAKEYLWTTPQLSGVEAAEWNLVNRAVPAEELDRFVDIWADRIASMPAENIRLMRRGLRRLQDMMGFREAAEMGADLDALGHTGPATQQWRDTVQRVGLKEAIRLRDEPFNRS